MQGSMARGLTLEEIWNVDVNYVKVTASAFLFVCPFIRPSTFMSKFDIYVKVSILINYKTKQPSNLA